MIPEYDQIPDAVLNALVRYKDWRVPTGSFCRAIISNDLISAIQKADSHSLKALPHIAAWAYNELPSDAWGSYDKFQNWIEHPIARELENEKASQDA